MKAFKSPEDIKRLVERLSKLPQVRRYSDETHDEAGTLAHALSVMRDFTPISESRKKPVSTPDL